jgi:predicted nucleotidyltransferase
LPQGFEPGQGHCRNQEDDGGEGILSDSISSEAREAVASRLDFIIEEHKVTIPLAIESGSRAWGFPSPDSDYDCRFIFVRPLQDTLRLFRLRDVIETPLTAELDVNGWEISKAIKLILKGNAVVIEWLQSPIACRIEQQFRIDLLSFATVVARRPAIANHYLHLIYSMRDRVMNNMQEAPLKKLFYAARPALALRWMRLHPERVVPPMAFGELCAAVDLPSDLQSDLSALLERKKVTRELGKGPVPSSISKLIVEEIDQAERWIGRPGRPVPEHVDWAEKLHRDMIAKFAPKR